MTTTVLDHHHHHADTISHNHILAKSTSFAENAHHDGAVIAKQMIGEALHRRVEAVDHELCEPGDEDTFFVADLGDVYRQHMRWKKNLPRVKPFYGMLLNQPKGSENSVS